jgi:SAM-dependent methyltransferase
LARCQRRVDQELVDGSKVTVQGVVTDPGGEVVRPTESTSAPFVEVFVIRGALIREHQLYIGEDYAGTPPWDIGSAQPDFVALAESGSIVGRVLDVGCGTGENALYFSQLGHDVVGIDASRLAIEKARAKAGQRRLGARFVAGDATALPFPDGSFDTSIDSGLFHILSEDDQAALVAGLHRVLRSGGRHHLMCLSEHASISGPRHVTHDYLKRTFEAGWRVESIDEARFALNGAEGYTTDKAAAWLATVRRL